jgi:hypothetical protein
VKISFSEGVIRAALVTSARSAPQLSQVAANPLSKKQAAALSGGASQVARAYSARRERTAVTEPPHRSFRPMTWKDGETSGAQKRK